MKRYLLFVGSDYYPGGGAGDLLADFDTFSEAFMLGDDYVNDDSHRWAHILDTQTGEVEDVEDVNG